MIGKRPSAHVWRFFRAGGFDQVRLETGADLAALDQLDQKLWVALSCPTRGLEFDTRTLDMIDADKDGRIRVPEVIAAVKWACACLITPDVLIRPSASLPLAAINEGTPEGAQLLAAARHILQELRKKDAQTISVEDCSETMRVFAQRGYNGDGTIPADAAEDDATKALIGDIISCLGAETDRSGKPGVNQAKVDKFFADSQAHLDWRHRAESDPGTLPLGEATVVASAALDAVRAKVDDYFTRCRLASFDARSLRALKREEAEYHSFAAKDLSLSTPEITALPLALIGPDRPLPLKQSLNPAWMDAMARFDAQVVKPLMGEKPALSEAEWSAVKARFAAYEQWMASKAGASVEKLGLERLKEILSGNAKATLQGLIARDKALEPEVNSVVTAERLLRFHRHLHKLLNNFVSFRDFYYRKEKAVFQAGTLYLDQRSCDLCIWVEDVVKHAAMATLSYTYLVYCEVTRKSTGEKRTLVSAFTGGDSDNLMIGRNGIFYDRQGRDWDATVTKIIENPISIQQAVWSPYKKFIRLVETQVERLASAREKALQDIAATKVSDASKAVETGQTTVKRDAFDVARFAGIFAAIGLAIGAIGGAVGAVLTAFAKLAWWQFPLAIFGIMTLISGPSVIIAWLKLRQRNLGPILDASGWAVNAKARINLLFGHSLTSVAKLPPGSERDLTDPYSGRTWGRYKLIAVLLLLAVALGLWYFGVVERSFPGLLPKSSWVKAREPAPETPKDTPAVPAPESGQEK
jgi:hypothetical protein